MNLNSAKIRGAENETLRNYFINSLIERKSEPDLRATVVVN